MLEVDSFPLFVCFCSLFALSLCAATLAERLDGMVETLWSAGTATLADGNEEDVFRSYHGSSRLVQELSWKTPPAPIDVGSEQDDDDPEPVLPFVEEDNTTTIIVAAVVGGLCFLLVIGVVIGALAYVRRAHRRERERELLLNDDFEEQDRLEEPDG